MPATIPRSRSAVPRTVTRTELPSALKPLMLALLSAFPLHGVAAPPPAAAVPKAPTVGWRVSGVGAVAPVNRSNSAGGIDQTIDQSSKTGIYNWQSFDIGSASSVTFSFSSKDSSALNRVTGSAAPSQIFGALKSQYANPDAAKGGYLTGGSIYLINANGILFGSGAKVNVGSLIASTLDLSNANYESGLASSLAGRDAAFAWGATNGLTATGLFSNSDNFVRVDAGAQISTASGGRVFLFAKKVENAGAIATPDGQTVLAGGSEVYLQNPTSEALYASEANPIYPVVKGLLVEVGKGAGSVGNLVGGTIETARGNTTLVGMAVNQLGRISATTSVSQNGSVLLLARGSAAGSIDANSDGIYTKRATVSGALTLGAGSSIAIAPDTTPGGNGQPATADGNAVFTSSRVELAGKTIDIQSGAQIVAHGGIVNARAEAVPYYPNNVADPAHDYASFNGDNSVRLTVGDKAVIDVSGTTTTTVSAARNFVTTALLGKSDLKDAPLQKDGPLYRSKVTFDLRDAIPVLGDTSAYASAIQRSAEERLAKGGSISLTSTGTLATHAGSTLNVSGGQVNYTDAMVNETRLIAADGTRYTLDKAPKDIVYTGIEGASGAVTLDRWGIVPQWVASQSQTGHLEKGYVDGKAGGTLSIAAPISTVDGQILAKTVAGVRQTGGPDALATGGSINLGFRSNGNFAFGSGPSFVTAGLGSVTVTEETASPSADVGADPRVEATPTTSRISAQTLNASGASKVVISSDGDIDIRPGADIVLGPMATLDLAAGGAAGITIGADFRSEGGTFTARTRNLTSSLVGRTKTQAGGVVLQPGTSIDVSGDWVNRALDGADAAAATAGGRVTLSSARGLVLEDASRIDVSGGATVATNGSVKGTDAGSITIESDMQRTDSDAASRVHVGADLVAQSLTGGGTLALHGMDTVVVGAQPTPRGVKDGPTPGSLLLSEQFFRNGAFTTYDIQAVNKLQVASGVTIAPKASNWVLTAAAAQLASGTKISSVLDQGLLPDSQRKPVSVSLGAIKSVGSAAIGDLTLASGAQIVVDPLASVTLAAGLNLDVEGRISAPGGTVNLSLKNGANVSVAETHAEGTLRIGSSAVIDVSGQAALPPQNGLLQQGRVLAGGSVNIEVGSNASLTPVEIMRGAVIKADGASAVLGVTQTTAAGSTVTKEQTVSSDGGSVKIVASEGGAVLLGDMHARAGDASATGGSFELQLAGRRTLDETNDTARLVDAYTIVVQDAPIVQADAVRGSVRVSAQTLEAGFADVTLQSKDRIRFNGDVNLAVQRNLVLDAPLIAASPQSRNVTLAAGSTLLLGSAPVSLSADPTMPSAIPLAGAAQMTLQSGLVEFYGTQAFQGLKSLDAKASSEIRLNGFAQNGKQKGQLSLQSDLTLDAPQVTVSSNSAFTIDAAGQKVLITGGKAASTAPLSAGGAITINASEITTRNPADTSQYGVLRAPNGSVTLNATDRVDVGNGSLISVSGDGMTVLYGTTVNGTGWTYNGQSVDAPAVKTVSLNAKSVNVAAGSTIDVSGGGDLVATEFVAGSGGSTDIFAGAAGGAFAIVPSVKGYAPQDADGLAAKDATGATASGQLGRQITVGTGGPVPAGTYTVLPARYALLAGAYLVQPVASSAPLSMNVAVAKPDGSVLIGARLSNAGSGATNAMTQTFQVMTSVQAQARSEVRQATANTYFAEQAKANGTTVARLPQDAGRINIAAEQLALKGSTRFAVPKAKDGTDVGLGGELDISADRIRIGAGTGVAQDGVLSLATADLNASGAALLVIGGTRTGSALQTQASEVVVDNAGQTLQGADVVLVAKDRVELADGAAIAARGATAVGETLKLSGDGALLRVSNQASAATARSGALRDVGDLIIGAGAQLSGASITAEATHTTTIAADAKIAAASVTVGANRIAAGAFDASQVDATTLLLTPALAAQLGSAQALTLRSYDGLDLYGDAKLGGDAIRSLTLDTGTLRVVGAGAKAQVAAGGVQLVNSTGTADQVSIGSGELQIVASGAAGGTGQVVIGPGSSAVSGASTLTLTASHEVVMAGQASLAASGDVTIRAAALQTTQAADAVLSALGKLTIEGNGTATVATSGAGAHLVLDAASIEQAGRVVLPSGELALTARAGDVHFVNGSTTDVSGRSKTFDGVTVATSGGALRATSMDGNIVVDAGARLDVSAAPSGGGGAGTLSIVATKGSVTIAGNLRGNSLTGQGGGSLAIDSATAVDLAALAATLAAGSSAQAGNFSEAIDVRNRVGDQQLQAGGPGLVARHITISSDSGSLSVAGKLDASGASGTTVTLAAGKTLTLQDGASITAHSTGSVGGEVSLMAGTAVVNEDGEFERNGQVMLNGGTIDTSAAGGGSNGTVLIRAQRTDAGTDVRVGKVAGSTGTAVIGAARIEVEAVKQYAAEEIDATLVGQVNADNTAFAGSGGSNATIVRNRVAGLLAPSSTAQTLELRAGVEVDQVDPGIDLLVTGNPAANGWNLTSFDQFGKALAQPTGAPVNLTLRAAGNLNVQASISDGFMPAGAAPTTKAAASKITTLAVIANANDSGLEGGRIRLVGGADLGAANVMATTASADQGDVTIGADGTDVIVRSTTGTIQIAAGRDITLLNHQAAVYTTGVPVDGSGYVGKAFLTSSLLGSDGVAQSPTLSGGGSVSVQATRDVVGAGAMDFDGQYASEWLWRGKDASVNGQATWWARYDRFRQGFATFGGGNVTVDAGRDAVNVEASAASSGYIARDAAGNVGGVQRFGGGDLSLSAARDIVGGFALGDNGALMVRSGRNITTPADVPALQVLHGNSTVDIEARNDADVGLVTSFGLVSGAKQAVGAPVQTSLMGLAPDASLRMVAATGDLNYRAESTTDSGGTAQDHADSTGAEKIIPDTALFAAPSGSVTLGLGGVVQVSGSSTSLDVLAQENATVATVKVGGTDARQAAPTLIDKATAGSLVNVFGNGLTPLDNGDRDPVRVVAAEGDVTISKFVETVKPLRLLAGRDVLIAVDQSFGGITVQHQSDSELSLIEAGRDIVFADTGRQNYAEFKVYGPGNLLAVAGRNVDLKSSGGFGTLGNRENAVLPAQGAALTVLAGVSLGSGDYAQAHAWYFELLGGTGVAGYAADLAAQLAALQAGQSLPGVGSSASQSFKSAAIDAQIAQTRTLVGGAAFDAAVLSDARRRSGDASIEQAAATKSFEALASVEKFKVVSAALATAWTTSLSAQQRHDTVLSMATALDPKTSQVGALVSFVASQTGQTGLSLAQTLAAFEGLAPERQLIFTNQVLLSEIRSAGRAASVLNGTERDAAYARAYDALAVVFPEAGTDGDLKMGSSQLRTYQDSSIAVLTPRGGVNVGELSAGLHPKPASALGIVTGAGGDISIAVRDNVMVNQSRVFTVGQGDLLMWASEGNLDAGRGAKTVTGAPPPVFRFDAQGNFIIDTSGSYSGSGIAVLDASSTLDLYAPKGEINSGDAGIKSLGNAYLGAARFVGADNLSVAGIAVGAPPPAPTGGDTAGLASVGQAATSAGNRVNPDDSEEEKERKRRKRLNLVLDFLGFGDGTTKP